ncbi:Metallo-dependent hydrolase [Aspergillus bertholletiae]|uniref:Metallo-dependent hydrolase n=1 Tax=Aspergillus bertholletiae TaxID=1226010 RepID=A0A5N7APP5_9EURO|nr:Metallo-dependent hydrolase [Aspergillus bertholletiae]
MTNSSTGKYLFTGGYVATVDDSLGEFACGAVLVEDGVITAIGSADELAVSDAEVIDTNGGVVIPGFVDTHRHTSLSLFRGIAADQSLVRFLPNCYMRWLPAVDAEGIHAASLVGALEALESGVTTLLDCVEAPSSREHAEANLQALKDSGIRAFYCYGMSDHAYGESSDGLPGWKARLAHLDDMYRLLNDHHLVRVGLETSHPGLVPFDQTEREIRFAQEREMLCCSHTAPFMNTNLHNGVQELADRGLLLPGHVHIHCTSLNHHEMELLARSGGKISIATETEMQMGMGIPPIRACIEHGIKPTLSVDTTSIVAPDYLSQMRLALQLQRFLDHDKAHASRKAPITLDLGVRDALTWATRNGADAVGMADRIGTLTPGKRADIVFISSKRFLSTSAFPLGTAILHSTPADVDTVMVDGVIRKRHGQLVGYDLDSIRATASAALQRVMANLPNFRPEMTEKELGDFLLNVKRLTRTNLAGAYQTR